MASDSDTNAISKPQSVAKEGETTSSASILANIKFESQQGLSYPKVGNSNSSTKANNGDGIPRVKRPYNKKRPPSDDDDKPPPKKRGRKSKKELLLMNNKSEISELMHSPVANMKIPKTKKLSGKYDQALTTAKSAKKASTKTKKQQNSNNMGPSALDKKILAGPHLTVKQVLEYILTDHSYCVPPDPLPAVGSNHQMIRYILGPKGGAKARTLPIHMAQFTTPSIGQHPSKLEHLLKRRDTSSSVTAKSQVRNAAADYRDDGDIEIDVESVDPDPDKRVVYDVQMAKEIMSECEKYVEFARKCDTGDEWESKVLRIGWTKPQSALFDKVVGALHGERLSRLAYQSIGDTEPVLRRASLDKTVFRIRRIFGEFLWDTKLTQWLHGVLTESLNFSYLAIYLDVLQTLKSFCPQLVSRMMKLTVTLPLQTAFGREEELANLLTPFLDPATPEISENKLQEDVPVPPSLPETSSMTPQNSAPPPETSSDILLPERSVVPHMKDAMEQLQSAKNAEALRALLERPWDPYSPVLLQRLKKLSASPVFLIVAPGAIFPKFSLHRRLKQFCRMFSRVGKVVKVSPGLSDTLEYTSVSAYLERTVYLAKEKIRHVRMFYPERPLYLVGWGSGSILTAKLSVTAGPVEGIISLGFPLHSLKEVHDDVLKIYTGIKHPILFIIGGLASNNCLTDMELFRKRLQCETSLVIVGSGNENLYVARDYREKLFVTQSYVDKTVMDEIAYFVNLHSKHRQTISSANISMRPQHFSKPQGSTDKSGRKSSGVRGKKRKASNSSTDFPSVTGNNEGGRTFVNENMVPSPKLHHVKKEFDSPKSSPYDYTYDLTKYVPSNKSSNKRKAYYRPDPSTPPSGISSSSCVTASQLVQQSPHAKRRMSKPSGPSPRVPMLGPQSSRVTPSGSLMEDAAASNKYRSPHGSKNLGEQNRSAVSTNSPAPYTLMQRVSLPATGVDPSSLLTPSTKKKSSKSKSRPMKSPLVASTASFLSLGSSTASPTTSQTTPKLSHQQQIARDMDKNRQQSSQSPQLYKLLSPTEPDLKQAVKTGGPEQAEIRTTLISKQNLVTNMTLPCIKLAGGGTEEISQPIVTHILQPTPTVSSSALELPVTSQSQTGNDKLNTAVPLSPASASNKSKPAETVADSESMDVETEEEEMSGLLISSTFSVCPTSGQRVSSENSE